ncbi:Protein GUCD1, partial [Bienertia sinuspersici]
MWPLCIFVNKLLKLEEIRQKISDCRLSNSCSFKFSSTFEIDRDVLLPRSRFIEVPHVSQLSNWDCGLACVLMVCETIGINNCSLDALEMLCGTKSIWTVDLAHLLQSFSVIFSYFTVTLGANPNFSVESFYK